MGLNALTFHRLAVRLRRARVPLLPEAVSALASALHRSHLSPDAEIGADVELGYGGLGVVITEGAVVGPRAFLCQDVTIAASAPGAGAPVLEEDVFVGTGAKIFGPVRIGAGAKIGANAVVTEDVPAGSTVTGVPGHVRGERRAEPVAARG